MKKYTCHVPENLPDMKIGVYLERALPLLPYTVIRDALKKRDVKADGRRMSADERAPRGAEVDIYCNYEIVPDIVYEDDDVLILNKPAGLSCDEDDYGGMTVQSVLELCRPEAEMVAPVHRLDNRTCGLVLCAKKEEIREKLTEAFKTREGITKQYVCVVKGNMNPPEAVKNAFITKNAKIGRVRVISHNTPGSKEICTEYRTLSYDGQVSRLLITLHTGRTHQIRAHMAFLGHPVAGDDLYGDRAFNRRYSMNLMLCAVRLCFDDQIEVDGLKNREFVIDAPF